MHSKLLHLTMRKLQILDVYFRNNQIESSFIIKLNKYDKFLFVNRLHLQKALLAF